mmetsp:Transcript_17963/g.53983  ORF Transcript_17963/g.53983 Transcript_17963/m.53983 type:complete len:219 (-) Transcript_17963:1871-2527(-)
MFMIHQNVCMYVFRRRCSPHCRRIQCNRNPKSNRHPHHKHSLPVDAIPRNFSDHSDRLLLQTAKRRAPPRDASFHLRPPVTCPLYHRPRPLRSVRVVMQRRPLPHRLLTGRVRMRPWRAAHRRIRPRQSVNQQRTSQQLTRHQVAFPRQRPRNRHLRLRMPQRSLSVRAPPHRPHLCRGHRTRTETTRSPVTPKRSLARLDQYRRRSLLRQNRRRSAM